MARLSNRLDRFSLALQVDGAAHPLSAAGWSVKFWRRSGAPALRCVPWLLRATPPAFSGAGSVLQFAARSSEFLGCATVCPRTHWFRPWCPTHGPYDCRPPRMRRQSAGGSCSAPPLVLLGLRLECQLRRRL